MIRTVLLASGWMALFAVLSTTLERPALGHAFGALALAEGLASLMMAGLFKARQAGTLSWHDALERFLMRWVAACAIFLGALIGEALPLFSGQPLLLIGALGLALCIGALHIVETYGRSLAGPVPVFPCLRLAILATIVYFSRPLAVVDANAVVGLAGATGLVILLIQGRGPWHVMLQSPPEPARPASHGALDLSAVGLRIVDLLILPFLLPAPAAIGYLCARAVAIAVEVPLMLLKQKSFRAFDNVEVGPAGFNNLAARLNLGMLLVGGGVGMGVIAFAPYFERVAGAPVAEFREVLPLLVMAQMGPALFGAADLLLERAGWQRDVFVTRTIGIVGVCALAAALDPDTGAALAQIVVGLHLALGAVMASILAWRTGIWPGLTALLFRQIRLL
ncbi:hypothetical protein FIU94_06050 [Sulfitobacter sp. THAF37]|uniref:hypothetical protein n=1 Tax=Sulfitobacter sp. THAF37 TaxID=2587855 RepID=UPI001267A860|nr:hypothetical protein [Sulfitobacter sp. THAF37]QFT58384.1 hypothetical protein FIU94_06050 [Sulfitobacter sp. THAF37]